MPCMCVCVCVCCIMYITDFTDFMDVGPADLEDFKSNSLEHEPNRRGRGLHGLHRRGRGLKSIRGRARPRPRSRPRPRAPPQRPRRAKRRCSKRARRGRLSPNRRPNCRPNRHHTCPKQQPTAASWTRCMRSNTDHIGGMDAVPNGHLIPCASCL